MPVFLKNLDLAKINGLKRPTKANNRTQGISFPMKLFSMLQAVEQEGKEHIVSWHPNGLSFQVHNAKKFVEEVLPSHFRQTKYKSFQRQLNFYGFERITSGPLEGSYKHPWFVKGNEGLCKEIKRITQPASVSKPSEVSFSTQGQTFNYESSSEASESASPTGKVFEETEDFSLDNLFFEEKPFNTMQTTSVPKRNRQRDSYQMAMAMLESSVDTVAAPSKRDSLLQAVEAITSNRKRRSTIFENGARLSFVGQHFHFLPVEFTDLYST